MKSNIKKFFSNFEEIFASLFLCATTLIVIANVFLRYFFKSPVSWSEEVATGCFVWGVFLGAAACYKRKLHVSVDFLIKYIPDNGKKAFKFVINFILFLINAYIIYMAVKYVKVSYRKPTAVLGISSVTISSSILVSFILMTIYSVRFMIQDLKMNTVQLEQEEAFTTNAKSRLSGTRSIEAVTEEDK
ncbi:MAG: TRAP transporter small permease [Treponema sp.]|nr:TRAP transporter small permease [Treponema sp.]